QRGYGLILQCCLRCRRRRQQDMPADQECSGECCPWENRHVLDPSLRELPRVCIWRWFEIVVASSPCVAATELAAASAGPQPLAVYSAAVSALRPSKLSKTPMKPGTVASRAQSRCSSQDIWTRRMSLAPACSMRRRAASCAASE